MTSLTRPKQLTVDISLDFDPDTAILTGLAAI